jgi:cytochrome c-type biogenesis protein CcmE
LIVGVTCVEIVVEGDLSEEMSMLIAQEVLARAEETTRRKCILELL